MKVTGAVPSGGTSTSRETEGETSSAPRRRAVGSCAGREGIQRRMTGWVEDNGVDTVNREQVAIQVGVVSWVTSKSPAFPPPGGHLARGCWFPDGRLQNSGSQEEDEG